MRHGDHLRDDEMLRLVDGHLTPAERARAESHVAACVSCMGRRSVFARIAGARAEPDETTARHAAGRARLRARLGLEAGPGEPPLAAAGVGRRDGWRRSSSPRWVSRR